MKSDKISYVVLILELAVIIYLHAAKPSTGEANKLTDTRNVIQTQLQVNTPAMVNPFR